MILKISGQHSGVYLGASFEIDILRDDGRVVIGQAKMTGITRPFYPNHPVYHFVQSDYDHEHHPLPAPDVYFVFDGAEFHESKQWHADHLAEAHEAMRQNAIRQQAMPKSKKKQWRDRRAAQRRSP